MRNRTILLLVFGILFLSIPTQYTVAWKNGSYAYNKLDYDYEEDFGTHDWIASAALDVLLEDDHSQWSWLEERKEIYLLGTEAPDNGDLETHLDGETVEGFGDTAKHHVYYNEDGSIANNEDDGALRAKSCGDLADQCMEDNKLDQAAFYFGAMTHYIADLSMYAHIAENNVAPYYTDFDEHHAQVEGYVQTRTNEYDNLEEFFEFFDIDVDEKKPYDAAIDLGWDTYKDPDPSESINRDAKWLHDNFFTDWEDNKDDCDKDTTTHQLYYDRIEENLNNAIEAIVAAMNYIGGSESSVPSYPLSFTIFLIAVMIVGYIIIITKKKKCINH
ncbi:MAG: zinc dependent phospholipase C family protein [Promethearchaeota archaeon]